MDYPLTFKIILWAFKVIVELVYIPVHVCRLFKTPKKCSPVKDKILLLSAVELAERIRKKEIACVSVIEAYISRIKEVNPDLNAIIENRFQNALDEAKKVDSLLQNRKLDYEQIKIKYPLLGVPITIKGSIAVAGMMHTAGRVDHVIRANEDARAVQLARDAGAIPLLTSNVPELCLNWETRNKLVGTTSNPFDTRRTPGGSSGGEASLIGCGASLIGIGSDIAGSLRLPAHNCGIWGHKPSPFCVSTVGHYPDCKHKNEWSSVFTLGPLSRYAGDLRLLLSIIAEPNCKNLLKLEEKVDLEKVKIYYTENPKTVLADAFTRDSIEAVKKVIAHFDAVRSSKCSRIDIPLMKYCAELSYLRLLSIDDVDNVFEGRGEGAYQELFKFLMGKSVHEFTSICYGLLRRHVKLPVKMMNSINRCIEKLRQDFLNFLGDDGVFILPTSTCEAGYHGDVYRQLFNNGHLSIFNTLGFPVTNCPIGFSKNNMPIGIQVVSAPHLDRLTLRVAEEIERVFGGWNFDVEKDVQRNGYR